MQLIIVIFILIVVLAALFYLYFMNSPISGGSEKKKDAKEYEYAFMIEPVSEVTDEFLFLHAHPNIVYF